MESGNEIIIDYPLDKMASQVATACFAFNDVNVGKGEVNLQQVMAYLTKPSTLDI